MITDWPNGHCQSPKRSYRLATPDELRAKLGADHVAWILRLPNPVMACRGRARGYWDANDLETMSAYDRLADLIEYGVIA